MTGGERGPCLRDRGGGMDSGFRRNEVGGAEYGGGREGRRGGRGAGYGGAGMAGGRGGGGRVRPLASPGCFWNRRYSRCGVFRSW